MRFNVGFFLKFCFLSIISGCAVVPVEQDLHYSRASMVPLYELGHWSFEGRIAMTGQKDSWSANISWSHSPGTEKLKISGPLGQSAVIITLAGNGVTIDRGGNNIEFSDKPDEFINQQMGMFVPMRSLRYWVVGLPEPYCKYQDTDTGFNQSGWISEYLQMQIVNDGVIMPRKIVVMGGEVKLKLIIDQWVVNDTRYK